MNETRDRILNLVFVAFYVALAMVLAYLNKIVPIIQMPNGGSLELMVVPIFIASYHLGWKNGALVGILTYILGFFMGLYDYYLSPMQVVLDYIFPICFLGMASMFPKIKLGKISFNNIYMGITLCMVVKYVSHVLSGVYFYFPEGEAAGSLASWIYSLNYNLGYCAVTWIVAIIIVPILLNSVRKIKTLKFIGIKE